MRKKILFKQLQRLRTSTKVLLNLKPMLLIAASLIYLSAKENGDRNKINNQIKSHGGIIRGDTSLKNIALVFTGDEFGDGGEYIASILQKENVHASFFLTGNFYRNKNFTSVIKKLQQNNNYLGAHSDKHLLYCDWQKRDSLLVTKQQFITDIKNACAELMKWNIEKTQAQYFLPPYEWYNDSIAAWATQLKLQLVCFTPGTRSNADYTYPEMGKQYVSSDSIFKSVVQYEKKSASGLNGFILLLHIGTDPRRKDKFYYKLPALIAMLQNRGYHFVKINELLR